MARARVLAVVAVALVAGWSSPSGADVEKLRVMADPHDGSVWATAEVTCVPGDVEVDLFVTQDHRGNVGEAHVELFGVCPPDGVFVATNASFDGDPLVPGPATVDVHEVHYCAEFGFSPCFDRQSTRRIAVQGGRPPSS